jgi:hypothetical protein
MPLRPLLNEPGFDVFGVGSSIGEAVEVSRPSRRERK